jgi:hypothetical protein
MVPTNPDSNRGRIVWPRVIFVIVLGIIALPFFIVIYIAEKIRK